MDEILKLFGGAENIWTAIQNNAGDVGIETTRVMLELFYVLKSPETKIIDKTLIVTALGYQLLSDDVFPREKYGLFGLLDNFVTIGFAYSKVKSSVTPQITNQVNNILQQWFGIEQKNEQLANETTFDNFGQLKQPVYNHTRQQSSYNNHQQPNPQIWDENEDVVID